jgi:hypothetical protein
VGLVLVMAWRASSACSRACCSAICAVRCTVRALVDLLCGDKAGPEQRLHPPQPPARPRTDPACPSGAAPSSPADCRFAARVSASDIRPLPPRRLAVRGDRLAIVARRRRALPGRRGAVPRIGLERLRRNRRLARTLQRGTAPRRIGRYLRITYLRPWFPVDSPSPPS